MKSRSVKLEGECYRIVTWAANTTGNRIFDEICELAAWTTDSSFHKYIIPYCNVRQTHWVLHGLTILNSKKLRFLVDCNSRKILSTQTEIYGLKNFLSWLSEVKGQRSGGIILVCYEEHNNALLSILWKSLEKYGLGKRFLDLVAGYVDCNSIIDQTFKKEKNLIEQHIFKILSNNKCEMNRSAPKARVCYEILTYLKYGNNENVRKQNGYEYIDEDLVYFVKPFMCDVINIKSIPTNELKVVHEKNKIIRSETITFKKTIEVAHSNSVKIIKETDQRSNTQYSNVKEESATNTTKSNEYNVVSWGINTTGYRITDCIFHIAAVSQQSKFSQFMIPKKNIRNSFKHNIEIVRENECAYLKNLQTQKIIDANTELTVLKDFISWLGEVKQNDSKGILLLYYRFRVHSITILLRALQRHDLMASFANVVIGFVNAYDMLKEKCGNITNSFKLDNVSQVVLKKKSDISDAAIRAELCLEVIVTLLENNMGISHSNNGGRTINESELYTFIETYATKLTDEVNKFKALKKSINAKRRLKRKNETLDKDTSTHTTDPV